jgi:hypothetical protein
MVDKPTISASMGAVETPKNIPRKQNPTTGIKITLLYRRKSISPNGHKYSEAALIPGLKTKGPN